MTVNMLASEDLGYDKFVGNVQNLHPLGLSVLAVACIGILASKPRASVLWMIVVAMWLSSGQRVVLGGADLSFLRVATLVATVRLFAFGSFPSLRFCAVDACVVAGIVARAGCSVITFGGLEGLVAVVGVSIDTVVAYFVVRAAIRSQEDVVWLAKRTLFAAAPLVALFAVEWTTGRNLMSVFGGIPPITDIREGRLRCQGAFSHPILAGCFFVAVLPLWMTLWARRERTFLLVALGLGVACSCVFFSSSSTPVVALVFTFGALACYGWWRSLRSVLYAALGVALVLHFLMKHGIWHLIARIDMVGGSTGYHRYYLIDKAIERVGEWWLFGTPSTAHWGFGLWDVTNQYILDGVRGGIWGMLALFLSVVLALAGVGRALRALAGDPASHWMAYCAGVSVFSQAFIFLAVSYFGQIVIVWPLTLAIAVLWSEPQMWSTAPTRGTGFRTPIPSAPARRPARADPLPFVSNSVDREPTHGS